MKAKELEGYSVEELRIKADELSRELFNLKFQLHTGHLDNTAKISQLRKDIARTKTILHQKLAS
ncbi:MAG: 50S ribosomal protein L29 [Desulfuromonadaceae bacterium]|nr:50S ribosomal protein L29 [Desulfuromonadaceae bacterium]